MDIFEIQITKSYIKATRFSGKTIVKKGVAISKARDYEVPCYDLLPFTTCSGRLTKLYNAKPPQRL